MAPGTFQEAFCVAVQKGAVEEWRQLLSENRKDPNMNLDLGVCLLDAVRHSCPAAVSDILQFRPPLNTEDSQGQRVIHLAARYGPQKIVRLLALAGSTLNCSNREGWTPLHIACHFGNQSTAEQLVIQGANTNAARTDDKLTPLHIAVQHQHQSIVDFLLQNGADPNTISSKKHGQVSALAVAVVGEDASVLKTFLKMALWKSDVEYSADVSGSYPLHRAVEKGHVENLRHLLSYLGRMKLTKWGIDSEDCTNEFQRTFLLLGNQEERRMKHLLNLLDGSQRTALHLAIMKNRREIVQLLLDAGADVFIPFQKMLPFELATRCVQPLDAFSPLPMNCSERHNKLLEGVKWDDGIVRLLFEYSVNVDTVTETEDYPIHLALYAGLYDLALEIVAKMPHRINHANAAGETPLHIACRRRTPDHDSRLKLIRKLLELGLSVDACNNERACPLSFAVMDDDVEVVSIILSSSPDLSTRDGNGFTPLHYAVHNPNTTVLEAILDARPEVVVFDDLGPSPMYLAVAGKNVKMVRCLLARNADPNHRDSLNEVCLLHGAIGNFLSISSATKCLEIVELLVKSGADLNSRDHSNLTPLQHLLQIVVCFSMLPQGRELAMGPGMAALKVLVEAGSELWPWRLTEAGVMRRSPLQSMAYCGLLPMVYYLANAGWPLGTEIRSSSTESNTSDGGQGVADQPDWVHLPGNSPAQDNLHAFLMLRNANPFTLLHLARTVIRSSLVEVSKRTHGGQRREIGTLVDKLPVPELMKKYVHMQDWDYSSAEESWRKLLHVLPSTAADEAMKTVLSSESTI